MYCNKCGDKIDENEKYCDKCGNHLENIKENNKNNITTNSSNSNINNNKLNTSSSNLNRILLGTIIGSLALILICIGLLLSTTSSNKYYFGADYNKEVTLDNDNDDENDSNAYKTVGNASSHGKYSTSIIYDNYYTNAKLTDRNSAIALIKEDSNSQKDACPKEIKSLEEELIKKYDVDAINLCEMDYDFAKEIGDVFKRVYEEFPEAKGYITNFSLFNAGMSEANVIAEFMPYFAFAFSDNSSTFPWVIKTQILLNSKYFLNKTALEKAIKESSEVGHFPKNSNIYAPVAHELGHYISFLAMKKKYNIGDTVLLEEDAQTKIYELMNDFSNGDYSKEMIEEAYNKYKKDKNVNITFDEFRGTISKYALAKDNNGNYIYDETIAEAFHDVFVNKDNANDSSKYIIEVLKSRIKG